MLFDWQSWMECDCVRKAAIMASHHKEGCIMSKQEWISVFAQEIMGRTGLDEGAARSCAESSYETDPELDPAEAVDEEIHCWQ